jgi:hypothetical protein
MKGQEVGSLALGDDQVDQREQSFEGVVGVGRLEFLLEPVEQVGEKAREEVFLVVVVVVDERLAPVELVGDASDRQLRVAVVDENAIRRLHDTVFSR